MLGESGSGKTVLVTQLVKQCFPSASNVLVVTPYSDEFTFIPPSQKILTVDPSVAKEAVEAALRKGNTFIVIDDADLFLGATVKDEDLPIRYLLISSRHVNVGWLLISRRTQEMPKLAFKQATKLFFFQTDSYRDLEIIKLTFNEQDAQAVKSLDASKHECYFVDRKTKERKIITAKVV